MGLFKMDKRGISAIVATVLTILITVAAIAIVWVAIVPMINENIAFDELDGRVTISTAGGYTVYDADADVAIVQVKRDVDDGVMNRIKIIFMIGGESVSSNVVAPDSGQTKTYTFDLSDYGEPESVAVAAIFVSASGKEKEGSVTSKVDMPSGKISSVDADVLELDRDYFYEMPMTGLVSWWKFEGDATDSVGENDGTIVGDVDYDNNVLNLDGDEDYVNVGWLNGIMNNTNSFTISAWVFPVSFPESDSSADDYMILNFGGDSPVFLMRGNESISEGWIGGYYGDDRAYHSLHYNVDYLTNEWKFLVLTYDGSNIYFYINSMLINETLDTHKINQRNSLGRIGAGGSSIAKRYFNGSIDDVMVFDKALIKEEVIAIYENQRK